MVTVINFEENVKLLNTNDNFEISFIHIFTHSIQSFAKFKLGTTMIIYKIKFSGWTNSFITSLNEGHMSQR